MPAGGSEIPTFLSYLIEKRLAKNPEEFGQGAIEAVAGPEAANNAAAAGTLGAPAVARAFRPRPPPPSCSAAFQQYGLQPGPLLFESNPDLVWGLIASLYIGNVLLLSSTCRMAGIWVKLLAIPRPWLYGGILVFATLGAYTLNNNVVDLVILWIIGLLGFGMRVLDVPVAPVRRRPDPRARWPSSSSAVRCRSARATRRCSLPTRSRSRSWPSRSCWCRCRSCSAGASAMPIAEPARLNQPTKLAECLPCSNPLTSLFTLTVLEVVLSIDNLVVIAVLVGKLPKERQARPATPA